MKSSVHAGYMCPIRTRYHGPTNTKPSRLTATALCGDHTKRITVYHSSGHTNKENHEIACQKLSERLGWNGRWIGAETRQHDYVFVCAGVGV